jgi:hypothetical protein
LGSLFHPLVTSGVYYHVLPLFHDIRGFSSVKDWLGLHDFPPSDWHAIPTVKDWWVNVIHRRSQSRKALEYLFFGRYGRREMPALSETNIPPLLWCCPKIKDEALMWYLAGAKALTIFMSRE